MTPYEEYWDSVNAITLMQVTSGYGSSEPDMATAYATASGYIPNIDYVTNQNLPTELEAWPYFAVIDLEDMTVIGESKTQDIYDGGDIYYLAMEAFED